MKSIFVNFLSIFLVFCLFFNFVFSYRVFASDLNSESLPSNLIDIECSYDSDFIYLDYNGYSYSLSRNSNCFYYDAAVNNYNCFYVVHSSLTSNSIQHSISSNKYYVQCRNTASSGNTYTLSTYVPNTISSTSNGYDCDYCMWYSPSQNRVYVISSGVNEFGNSSGTVRSYSNGSFYVDTLWDMSAHPQFNILSVCYFDLSSGSGTYSNVSKSAYQIFGSGFNILDSFYVNYRNCYNCNYCDSGIFMDGLRTGLNCCNSYSFPTDLVCIFSTYNISGFYNIDYSFDNIITPNYYFSYQYVFLVKNKGYIFLDSVSRLKSVVVDSGNIIFYFFDDSNFYVYSSFDGLNWSIRTSVTNMYGSIYIYSSWEVDDYILVYSSDSSYGSSLKEWSSLDDVIIDLPDFLLHEGYIFSGRENSNLLHPGNLNMSILDFLDILTASFYTSSIKIFYDQDWNHLGSSFSMTGAEHNISYTKNFLTFYGLLDNVYILNSSILSSLSSLRNELKSYISVVNDNLSILIDIYSSLASFPNYNSKFDDIVTAINCITFPDYPEPDYTDIIDAINGISFPDFPDFPVPDYSDIIAAINAKDLSVTVDGAIVSIPEPDYTDIIDAINDITFPDFPAFPVPDYTDIISAINSKDLSVNVGGATVSIPEPDYSDIIDAINDIKFDIDLDFSFDINDYDSDPDDDDTSVPDFISNGLHELLTGTIISHALDFDSPVLDGIQLINGYVVTVYNSLGSFKPVILLGLTFTVVDVAIRKEES